jgi:transposase
LLLDATVARARSCGLIGPKPRAAIDATGYETRHASRYYVWRKGKRHHKRSRWPKLTAVLETASHVFLSAHVGKGPSADSPAFKPAARAAVARCEVDTMLGDSGYDAEHNHPYARKLGVRSSVIALNRRRWGRKWPQTRYRRQMVKRFRKRPRRSRYRRVYGQRWQVESGWSRNKRLLGSALRARKWPNQKKEILLRVLTHNLMLLAAT